MGLTGKFRIEKFENYDLENDGIIVTYVPKFEYVSDEGGRMYVVVDDQEFDNYGKEFLCGKTREEARGRANLYVDRILNHS